MSLFQTAYSAIFNALHLKKSMERDRFHPETVEQYHDQMREFEARYPDDIAAQMAAKLGHTDVLYTQQLERSAQRKAQMADLMACLDDPKGCVALMAALAEHTRFHSPEAMAVVLREDPDALDSLSAMQAKLDEAKALLLAEPEDADAFSAMAA